MGNVFFYQRVAPTGQGLKGGCSFFYQAVAPTGQGLRDGFVFLPAVVPTGHF